MASTKIINVLRDDKFEEILDLFKETSAKEVIFVLPKKSKALASEQHFIILANEASKGGKKLSVLCSNPDINKLAKKFKFDVLMAKAVNEIEKEEGDEDDDADEEEIVEEKENEEIQEEDEDEEEEEEIEEEEPEAEPVAVVTRSRGGLEGIVKKTGGTQVNLSVSKEKPIRLDIKKKTSAQSVDDIENIWAGIGVRQNKASKIQKISSDLPKFRFQFKNISKKTVIAMGVVSIFLLGAVVYVSTGSAKIEIRPQKQQLGTELKISASDKFSLVDQNLNKIPGQLFSIDKTVSQIFSATGEKDVAQKARGKITVFNEYGTSPQVLVATTRFESPEGLIFRTLKTVTVPGTSVENGKITPGEIDVEVVADKPGPAYNISAAKFSIPAFKERNDANRYEKFYGQATEAMKGGMIGRAKVVTETDYSKAKDALQSQLQKEIDEGLKIQTAGLKTLDNLSVKIGLPESSVRVDEAADTFTMSLKGSLETIGFKEADLLGLIKQNVEKTRDLTVIPEKLQLTYKSVNLKETENLLEFTVFIAGNVYAKIETSKIKSELSGKDEDEIKSYIRGVAGVETARVSLSPFWVKRIPDKPEKTVIEIIY